MGKGYGIWGPTQQQGPSRPLVNHIQSWHLPRNIETGFCCPKIPSKSHWEKEFFHVLLLCYVWSPTISRHTGPAPSVLSAERNIILKQHLLGPPPSRKKHHR